MTSRLKTDRYQTLDGLRGVGAIAVFLLHFASILGIQTPHHGYLAVDLFFCLSGFVLENTYSGKIREGMNVSHWISVRLIRLYPLYILSIILAISVSFFRIGSLARLTSTEKLVAILAEILMLPSPTWSSTPEMYPLNFVAWSLLVEMFLSVMFFWACRFKTRSLWLLAIAGVLGLVLVRLLVGYVGGGFAWRDAVSGLVRGLFGFSAGMLVARYQRRRRQVTYLAYAPALAAAMMMWIDPPHAAAYDLTVIILLVPALTYFSVHVEPPSPALFRNLGDLSYAVYALHNVVFSTLESATHLNADDPAQPFQAILILAGFALLCWIADRFYDGPIRFRLSSALRAKVAAAAAP